MRDKASKIRSSCRSQSLVMSLRSRGMNRHSVALIRSFEQRHAAAPCFLPAYSPDLDPIDPSAGSGRLRQLSAGFSTKPRLLQPEVSFAQKQVAQNGPPSRRCSVKWPRISPAFFQNECFNDFQNAGYGST
jgi:hypothetical protein